MDRSGRYVACLVFGVAFAAAISRPGATPVATLAAGLASMDAMQRCIGVDASGGRVPHHRRAGSRVAKSIG
jgi:hypothetical protein